MTRHSIIISGIMTILLFSIVPVLGIDEPVNPVLDGNKDLNRDINYIYSEYSKELLLQNKWDVLIKGPKFKAFHYDNYNNRHSLLTIDIDASHKTGYDLFIVTTTINKKASAKGLKIPTQSNIPRDRLLRDIIGSYLVMKTFDFQKETKRRSEIAFHPAISAGFVRTTDWNTDYHKFWNGQGFISASVLYDPSLELMEEEMQLSTGDFLAIELFLAFDSQVKENYFNLNMLLTGNVTIFEARGRRLRWMHGLFIGFEYFRPSYSTQTMQLNQEITGDSIAFQFLSVKIIQYGLVVSWGRGYRQSFSLMAGLGPSVNSSLIATVKPEVYNSTQSHIFLAQPESQNYYFSISTPLSLTYRADLIYGFSMSVKYEFYYFTYYDLSFDAMDFLHIIKFKVGYNIVDNLFINARYEFWHVSSVITSDNLNHSWNRFFLELMYRI